ncbi:MAG TPA: SIS domain-containing protein [Bacteroidia bacterium]|jgi:D-sedoheptulose 7-phosphate isomerase|nr:SIS domain-containing protein [Bacteroidia bacterium]
MQTDLYRDHFSDFFASDLLRTQMDEAVQLVKQSKRIFFIGNGGSNSICSHMMEDYAKMGRYPTFAFSDPALITCYANDYGYAEAMKEWLRIHYTSGDLLIAISSSGESGNILNAVEFAHSVNGNVITLSGFKAGNSLSKAGKLNIHLPVSNYGIVECFHQVILHIVLDKITGTH